VQRRSQDTALQWNALNWGEKIAGKKQELKIGGESKAAISWKLGWIKSERTVVNMSKSETDIKPQLVDTLDICVDLDALSKHASLYLRRGIVYLVTEKRKRLKKANKWKAKLQKKERRPKLSRSFMMREEYAGKVCDMRQKRREAKFKKQLLQLHLFNGRKQKATRRFKSACSAAKFDRLRHFDRWLFYLGGKTLYESRRPQGDGKRWIRTEVGSGFTSDYYRREIVSVAKSGAWGIMKRREDSYVAYVDLIFYDNYFGGVP
jgi:hypothetical protein